MKEADGVKKAVFLGSKKFGLELFRLLQNARDAVEWSILCPPDTDDPRSRFEEFQDLAVDAGMELLLVPNAAAVTRYVRERQPDIMVVCGYYRILPAEVTEGPPHGVWGIHNSLLPEYRGGSPLVWQMINGEKILGSSFFRFRSGMDDGEVLAQVEIENSPGLTIGEAGDLIEREWAKKIPALWSSFCEGEALAWEQDHAKATYCAQRQDMDGLIDWRRSASEIDRFIRAQAAPYPRSFFRIQGENIRIVSHQPDNRRIHGVPGQVFEVRKEHVTVCCGGCSALRVYRVEKGDRDLPASAVVTSVRQRLQS